MIDWTYIWLIAGVSLLILEMFTGTLVLIAMALACIPPMVASIFGVSPTIQGLWFIFGLIITIPVAYHYAEKTKKMGKPVGIGELIGKSAKAKTKIGMDEGIIFVDGNKWQARSETEIKEGDIVTIENIDGTKLIVRGEEK